MGRHIGVEDDQIVVPLADERIDRLIGQWSWTLFDGDKQWNEHGRCITPVVASGSRTNLITTVGKGLILDRIFGLSSVIAIAGTAVGTSATAAAVGDTAITGAVYKAFAATPTRSGLTVTATTSYLTTEANINIQEAGLLTAAAGLLLNRVAPFASFTKTTSFALDVTTAVTQA